MDCSGPFSLPLHTPRQNDGRVNSVRARLIPFLGKRACTDQEFLVFPLAILGSGEWRSWSFLPSCPVESGRAAEAHWWTAWVNPGCSVQLPYRNDPGFPSEVSLHSSWLAWLCQLLDLWLHGKLQQVELGSLRSRHTLSSLGQSRKVCTNRV